MSKMNLLLIISLILAVVIAQDKDKERPVVESAVQPFSGTFALSWYGGFCATGECGKTQYSLWDRYQYVYLENLSPFMVFGQAQEPNTNMLTSM